MKLKISNFFCVVYFYTSIKQQWCFFKGVLCFGRVPRYTFYNNSTRKDFQKRRKTVTGGGGTRVVLLRISTTIRMFHARYINSQRPNANCKEVSRPIIIRRPMSGRENSGFNSEITSCRYGEREREEKGSGLRKVRCSSDFESRRAVSRGWAFVNGLMPEFVGAITAA